MQWDERSERQFDRLINVLQKSLAISNMPMDEGPRWLPPFEYPSFFQNLIREYAFQAFAIGETLVHGNLISAEDNLKGLLEDQYLTDTLVDAGFLPFGRPASGNYDRICFDARQMKRNSDAPIVRMDHESILSFDQIPEPILVASGFFELCMQQSETGPDMR
ncbi:hypothetical protein GC163_12080 [bacterium]|nr:hypothetical protein [bacterium]